MANYTSELINQVWQKAVFVSDNNESMGYRKDACGAWIKKSDYGNRNSQYGWEIDHIIASSNGGSDALNNLRPLHWRNNAAKSDGRLVCVVKSDGSKNVILQTI